MARQESAANGRDDSPADVIIVGESRMPVAVMRQQQNPWGAIDEDDEEEVGRFGIQSSGGLSNSCRPRKGRRRRESRDESEDPATAMSVVSEQLWGLQQKLVGTYMAVARARLDKGFPNSSLAAEAPSATKDRPDGGKQQPQLGKRAGGNGAFRKTTAGSGGGPSNTGVGKQINLEDQINDKTRLELVNGALDALRPAWEHLAEAITTLDRRAAAAVACEEKRGMADEVARVNTDFSNDGRSVDRSDVAPIEGSAASLKNNDRSEDAEHKHVENLDQELKQRWQDAGGQEEQAEDLGPLWKGSLSEALARSGGKIGDGHDAVHNPDSVDDVTIASSDDLAGEGKSPNDHDAMGSLAWNHTARHQLEVCRAELFELCGDAVHACVSLRSKAVEAEATVASPHDGTAELAPAALPIISAGVAEVLGDLPSRLQELLSSARPPVMLEDLDICQELHGHVWESLHGKREHSLNGTKNSKKGRDIQSQTRAEPVCSGISKRHATGAEAGRPQSSSRVATTEPASSGNMCNNSDVFLLDPSPLIETCVHSLAKAGQVPADPTTWSLYLAIEACYKRALLDLARDGAVPSDPFVAADNAGGRHCGGDRFGTEREAVSNGATVQARARLRKKLGDASNELGKLMAQCATALVQAPPHPFPLPRSSSETKVVTTSTSTTKKLHSPILHPGLGCGVCVANAERWFRWSLKQFRAIGDGRNTALLLCNLASVERLKPRAFGRLKEACPTLTSGATRSGGSEIQYRGKGGSPTCLSGQ